jgi:hypothetical protein
MIIEFIKDRAHKFGTFKAGQRHEVLSSLGNQIIADGDGREIKPAFMDEKSFNDLMQAIDRSRMIPVRQEEEE